MLFGFEIGGHSLTFWFWAVIIVLAVIGWALGQMFKNIASSEITQSFAKGFIAGFFKR